MIKKLLSASLFAFVALAANAYEPGDYAYTKVGKYQITGENLVVNGQFKDGDTGFASGWTAIDATLPLESVFQMKTDGPNGSNTQQVMTGQTALTNGMYQKIAISSGGTYVVSFKVMGITASYTDLDMTGGNTNYMAAYYNTDGELATVDGTNLYYGTNSHVLADDGVTPTNGICGAYGFSFGTQGFTEAVFAVNATADGYIIIDFRGMNEGVEIADVECHLANEVYDDRLAENRLAYFDKYLQSEGVEDWEFYADFQEMVGVVKEGIANNASPEEMAMFMQDMEGVWAEFVGANFENMMDIISGGPEAGNNSANWMYWTSKYNKLTNEYKGSAPWTWSTDRWCHKTAAVNTHMHVEWNGKWANSTWNNIATLTYTLSPGKYFWGVSAQGGAGTLNKARWARSWANECAETKLFFNGDTIVIDTLNAARNEDYVLEFTLEEEKEVTFGIICNNVSPTDTYGFYASFYSPVLYKLRGEGLSEAQKAYLGFVEEQLAALAGRIEVANGYCAAANDTLPWGKEALAAGAAEAQARYDAWAALTQDQILEEWMDNELKLQDTIMNNGVRFLNNNYINPFLAMNAPFSDMLPAVASAEEVLGMRIYGSSSKKADLEASIAASKAMYAEKLKVAFSSEDSLALITQRESMIAMVEEFKAAIDATTVIDIDFNNGHSAIKEFVDPEGLVETYYTYEGAKGTMQFATVASAFGTTMFEIGYASANDEAGLANRTDSLGMLRVGNGEATVDITGVPFKETDIVNLKFDFFMGNLNKADVGYKVLTAEGDTICGLYYSPYDNHHDRGFDTFSMDYAYIPKVGASTASNAAIAAASNKTTFDVVLDYGAKSMYCVTTSSKGTFTSQVLPLDGMVAKFVLYSGYTNADRRSWFDNLKVMNIAAERDASVDEIQVVKPANGIMYNIMGQQILKPIKGQIYIQNGVKKIGK